MGELRPYLGQDYQDASLTTEFVNQTAGELSHFQPGTGIVMSYDDLKVIEAHRFVRSIAENRPIGATIADAVIAARLVEAVIESVSHRVWVSL